jgi:hypothetical protein
MNMSLNLNSIESQSFNIFNRIYSILKNEFRLLNFNNLKVSKIFHMNSESFNPLDFIQDFNPLQPYGEHILKKDLIIGNFKGLKDSKIVISKYDIFTLILDEIKEIFRIPYHCKFSINFIVSGLETPYLIYKVENEIPLSRIDFSSLSENPLGTNPLFLTEIRRLFCFRYLMCLTCNNESRINVIIKQPKRRILIDTGLSSNIYIPICSLEHSYVSESNSKFVNKLLKSSDTKIDKTVIKKWFNDDEEIVYNTIKGLLEGINFTELKIQINDIIQKYLKELREKDADVKQFRSVECLIYWNNSVIERIRNY